MASGRPGNTPRRASADVEKQLPHPNHLSPMHIQTARDMSWSGNWWTDAARSSVSHSTLSKLFAISTIACTEASF
eukprot:5531616-Pyramimonas_sp.AAC.1